MLAAVLLLGIRGFGAWTLGSAGLSKIRSQVPLRRLLAVCELIVATGLLVPGLGPATLLAAGTLCAGFTAASFRNRRRSGSQTCGCGTLLPLPESASAHMAVTALLGLGFSLAAASEFRTGQRTVFEIPAFDVFAMVTVPGAVLLGWQIRKSLADYRHERLGPAR